MKQKAPMFVSPAQNFVSSVQNRLPRAPPLCTGHAFRPLVHTKHPISSTRLLKLKSQGGSHALDSQRFANNPLRKKCRGFCVSGSVSAICLPPLPKSLPLRVKPMKVRAATEKHTLHRATPSRGSCGYCASRLEAHIKSPEGIFVLHPGSGNMPQAHFRPSMRSSVLQELKHRRHRSHFPLRRPGWRLTA